MGFFIGLVWFFVVLVLVLVGWLVWYSFFNHHLKNCYRRKSSVTEVLTIIYKKINILLGHILA